MSKEVKHEKANQQLVRLGKRLRHLRTHRGETMAIHKKISERYHVRLRQSYYSKLERGLASPPLRTLYALADYFGVDLSTLLDPHNGKNSKELQALLEEPELLFLLNDFVKLAGCKEACQYLTLSLRNIIEFYKGTREMKKSKNKKPHLK